MQILNFPKKRDLEPGWARDIIQKHSRAFLRLTTLLIRVVGTELLCDRCNTYGEVRRKTCTRLPKEAIKYKELYSIVGDRCCHCFLLGYDQQTRRCIPKLDENCCSTSGTASIEDSVYKRESSPSSAMLHNGRHQSLLDQDSQFHEESTRRTAISISQLPDSRQNQARQLRRAIIHANELFAKGTTGEARQAVLTEAEREQLALIIENAANSAYLRPDLYFKQTRTISSSIKVNPRLISGLLSRVLTPFALVNMTREELEQWKQQPPVEDSSKSVQQPQIATDIGSEFLETDPEMATRSEHHHDNQLSLWISHQPALASSDALCTNEPPLPALDEITTMTAVKDCSPSSAYQAAATPSSPASPESFTPSPSQDSKPVFTPPRRQPVASHEVIGQAFKALMSVQSSSEDVRAAFVDRMNVLMSHSSLPADLEGEALNIAAGFAGLAAQKQNETRQVILGMLNALVGGVDAPVTHD